MARRSDKARRVFRDAAVAQGDYGGVLIVKGLFAGFLGDYDNDEGSKAVVYLNPTGIVGAVAEKSGGDYCLLPRSHLRRVDEDALFKWAEERRKLEFAIATKGPRMVGLPSARKTPKSKR